MTGRERGAEAGRPAVAPAPPDPAAPIGLYVHFPFCAARCHYCAFYFVVGRADARAAYVDAVIAEIARRGRDPRFAGRRVHSVYLGGGTPSLLPPADVARIVECASSTFPFEHDVEISLECNPDGIDASRLAGFRAAGVNRVTLGWQSLRPDGLRALTRTHSVEDNVTAFAAARAAGFENVAVDLIFGRPGETPDDWRVELDEAARFGPDHVSAYELTFEEGTRLARRRREGRYRPPGEVARAEMFQATEEVLSRHGIVRYEISNFARAGRECRHNLATWWGGDLAGTGASAASHVANARWTNVADLDEYLRRIHGGEEAADPADVLDDETWAAEDLYLALRTAEGADADARLARVPEPARGRLAHALARAEAEGLLARRDGRVALTRGGLLWADSVFETLLPG